MRFSVEFVVAVLVLMLSAGNAAGTRLGKVLSTRLVVSWAWNLKLCQTHGRHRDQHRREAGAMDLRNLFACYYSSYNTCIPTSWIDNAHQQGAHYMYRMRRRRREQEALPCILFGASDWLSDD